VLRLLPWLWRLLTGTLVSPLLGWVLRWVGLCSTGALLSLLPLPLLP
jgi:hypothetical protein